MSTIMDAACVLPHEVLANVFLYLHQSDRKNVRLTCRSWNASCHHYRIVKREKFVFHPGVIRDDVYRTGAFIADCKTLRSDLEFYALPGTQIEQISSVWTWKECADRMTSLNFNECSVDKKTLKNVLLHCHNLTSLRISLLQLCHDWECDFPKNIGRTLDELISRKIKQENLVSFELFTRKPMRDRDVKKLFQILPQIRTFRHGCWNPDEDTETIDMLDDRDEDKAHCHALSEELFRYMPAIENFSLYWWTDAEWMKSSSPDLEVKFKELEVAINSGEEDDEDEDEDEDEEYNERRGSFTCGLLRNFFSKQTELEKLTLRAPYEIDDFSFDFYVTFLLEILKNSSKLKRLTFHMNYLVFQVAEFVEFLKLVSDFESLDICSFKLNQYDPMGLLSSLPQKFVNLKTLKLGPLEKDVTIQILKRCSNLMTLHLHMTLNDEILQTVFEHHTNLKELSLHRVFAYECTAKGFTGRLEKEDGDSVGYSITRLQDLERLMLTTGSGFYPFSKQRYKLIAVLLSEFNFPRLKHFEIGDRLGKEGECKLLETLSTKAPCLETLETRPNEYGIKPSLLLEACKKMKRLKCVKVVSHSPVEVYEQLFTECPSLVNIFAFRGQQYYEDEDTDYPPIEHEVYFYDRILKKLITVT